MDLAGDVIMSATDYFETLLLDHALRQQAFSIQDWWVGLWTSNPTAAGLLTNEVQAGDYTRKLVTWDAAFTNTSPLVWAPAASDWGNVSYVCLLNAPTPGSGNMMIFQFRSSLDMNPGIGLNIPANALTASVV